MEKKMPYSYLIIGSGLTGSTIARQLLDRGKTCLVLEKRPHVGGNVYTRLVEGIHVHQYGAHIFHTNNEALWRYVGRFVHMNRYTNSPIANYQGRLYNLPFNMNTFYQLWGVRTPEEARRELNRQRAQETLDHPPRSLEEQALQLVGRDIYEKLIKGYTEKQWGRPCNQLPPEIIRRLPVRLTFDNNYFNAEYQGVPKEGYTALIEKLLDGADVRCNTDYLADREAYNALAEKVIYTGCIDAFFDGCFGPLEYRRVRFETERLDISNYQGNAVVNYTDAQTPYTRIIEHKHFTFGDQPHTIISREYSAEWKPGDEPYYPINDEKNQTLYQKYKALADRQPNVTFCGRLAQYRYADMDVAMEEALRTADELLRS